MQDHSSQSVVTFAPDGENSRLLRNAFGRFATGVTIVTAASDDGPIGITANSFASVSLDPPLVLWSPDKNSKRFQYFENAQKYAIHILSSEQAELCSAFAKDAYALQNLDHEISADDVPLIDNCLARFECTKVTGYDGGDHLIVLGRVERAEMREGDALTFFAGKLGQFKAA